MPVQVLVEKSDSFGSFFNDVYQALELELSGLEYFTQAYIPDISCSGSYYKQFFSVVSFFDDTIIEVPSVDGVQYEKNLGDFGTYTEMTTFSGDHLARGSRVQSSKPVNVISENLCVINSASGDAEADTYLSSIVPNTALGNEYITPSITTGSSEHPGYSISVVAIANDTDVEFNGTLVEELMAGEAITFELPYSNQWSLVNCSSNCSVVQFSKSKRGTAGVFMTQIQSLQEFLHISLFHHARFSQHIVSKYCSGWYRRSRAHPKWQSHRWCILGNTKGVQDRNDHSNAWYLPPEFTFKSLLRSVCVFPCRVLPRCIVFLVFFNLIMLLISLPSSRRILRASTQCDVFFNITSWDLYHLIAILVLLLYEKKYHNICNSFWWVRRNDCETFRQIMQIN